MSENILINFSNAPGTEYQLQNGTRELSGGNPGAYIDGGTGIVTHSQIRVDLPFPSIVSNVKMDWIKYHDFGNANRQIHLYDEDDNEIATPVSVIDSPTYNVWHEADSGTISFENVSYVIFFLHASWDSPPNLHVGLDNCSVTFERQPILHEGPGECPCHESEDSQETPHPISLYHGEKRFAQDDLQVFSPTGTLTFTRAYRQGKQADFAEVGVGWTHNHAWKLTFISGSPNQITVRMGKGGIARFRETSSNVYDAYAGSTAQVVWNGGTSKYSLTAQDGSVWIFDSAGKLLERSWASGETWTYTYSSGKLSQVEDDYGNKLVFAYYTSGDHASMLYRVGDHSSESTLEDTTPDGRYVEYGYVLNKVVDSSGQIVNGTSSLLASVQDVRGEAWTFDYYGQNSNETDVRQLNFVTAYSSPSVDTTGDGTPDGEIVLNALSYTMQGDELAVNGGMEADSDWSSISGAAPTTNARSTGQVDSGTYSRHVVASAADQGIEGNTWALVEDLTYIVTARVYPVSGVVRMQVTGESAFTRTTVGTGNWQTLRAVYTPSANASGKKLQFRANGAVAEFYVDTVSIVESDLSVQEIVQTRGDDGISTTYTFQPGGENITTEETAGQVTTHLFGANLYLGTSNALDQATTRNLDGQFRPSQQTDGNGNQTQLAWSSDGKNLLSVADALENTTTFSYNSNPDDPDSNINNTLAQSQDAEGRQTLYHYDPEQLRRPKFIFVVDGQDIATNGGMEVDSDWTDIGGVAPTTNARSSTQVDTGEYARHVVASAANQGIEGAAWNLVADQPYTVVARVYPVSGVVKMQVTGTTEFDDDSTGTGEWETLVAQHTPTSAATGKKLQFIASGGASQFYVDTVLILKGTLEQWQAFSYDNKGRVLSEQSFALEPQDDTIIVRMVRETIRTYYTSGNGNGLLKSLTQVDIQLDSSNDVTTTYFYDTFGRVVQTNQSSIFGTCTKSRTIYDAAGNVVASICNFDLDVGGTASASSSAGSTTAANAFDEGEAIWTSNVDPATTAQWLQYDFGASNEKAVSYVEILPDLGNLDAAPESFTIQGSNNGSTWTTLLTATGETSWQASRQRLYQFSNTTLYRYYRIYVTAVDGGTAVSLTEFNLIPHNFPTNAAQAVALPALTGDPDHNRVTTYEYDSLGRRIKSTSNAGQDYAQTSLTIYDALNRVVRVIANFDGKDTSGNTISNPYTAARSLFRHSVTGQADKTNTRNLITEMVYNERGLVRKQIDVLGNVMMYGYDDADRLVKTVQNASDPDYDNSYAGDPDLSGYTASNEVDEDFITLNTYDANGSLVKTTDVSNSTTLTGYDALNRVVKTVRSASYPPYNLTTDPDLSEYVEGFNDERDLDLVTTTVYDSMGRVRRTRDVMGNVTLQGYDALGRVVKTIRSASDSDYDWEVDPDLSQYDPEDDADLDIISLTTYDTQGHTLYSEDVNGERTWLAYDGLGRQVKTIVNAVGTATDGGSTDPRSDTYTASEVADEDLISQTEHDVEGRVKWTQDVLGRYTLFGYDDQNRRVRVIRNASDQNYDTVSDPDLSGYVVSGEPDEDLITVTVYDTQGRVSSTFDQRGNETRYEYDELGRRIKTIVNYENGVFNAAYPDEDMITTTSYDLAGRITTQTDAAGNETRFEYDNAGRRIKTIVNYDDGIFNPAQPYQDLISETIYDHAGRVSATIDARGTQTSFTYDAAGRRATTTLADGTPLATTSRTLYNKAGQVTESFSPDGVRSHFGYDRLGRTIELFYGNDSIGNARFYAKDGRLVLSSDPLGVWTIYGYDKLRRQTHVVQASTTQNDPSAWVWDTDHWEDGSNTAIEHGGDNAANVITHITYDKGGRRTKLRDPRGTETRYEYDELGRRIKATANYVDGVYNISFPAEDLISTTSYVLQDGGSKVTLTDPMTFQTKRVFDRLGRLTEINYLSEFPKKTPDVTFTYDAAGNRTGMSESDGGLVRETLYTYDAARRLVQVEFNTDSDPAIEQTVSYEYDAGGLRTQMTLPGSLDVTYEYDARGRLITLTDWDGQTTHYDYDLLGRLQAALTANGLRSHYRYDINGRLLRLSHSDQQRILKDFIYTVTANGNRLSAQEASYTGTPDSETIPNDDARIDYFQGDWAVQGDYQASTDFNASLRLPFFGRQISLIFGTGDDHSLHDIYIDNVFWGAVDGYTAEANEKTITIETYTDTQHILEIRNRADRHLSSTGFRIQFKEAEVVTDYTLQTLRYQYDNLSRLLDAKYFAGTNLADDPIREYAYSYDLSGNRTQEIITVSGSPTTNTASFNALNQLTARNSIDYGYDANGNLIEIDSVPTYTWDRANRLRIVGDNDYIYAYNGLGQRVSQEISSVVTEYLLDTQPGLYKVLAATTGVNTTRYIHGAMGIHSQQNPDDAWLNFIQDGLGSVRGVYGESLAEMEYRDYDPYGNLLNGAAAESVFGYTGEPLDENGLLHLRARYYDPMLGSFFNLDPLETANRYGYVGGNPINLTDPSGFLKRDQVFYPDTETVFEGHAEYSCHCGWIDWSHVGTEGKARNVIDALAVAAEHARNHNHAFYGIDLQLTSIGEGRTLPLFDDTAIIPAAWLRTSNRESQEGLALSIFIDANESFEQSQGEVGSTVKIGATIGNKLHLTHFQNPSGLKASGFSEEDLVSDLIGFAIAAGYTTPTGAQSMCGHFTKGESQRVWQNTYGDSQENIVSINTDGIGWISPSISGWQSRWYPRLLPLLDCQGNLEENKILHVTQSGTCNRQNRQFPVQLRALLNSRGPQPLAAPLYTLASISDQHELGNNWWWERTSFLESGMALTNELLTTTKAFHTSTFDREIAIYYLGGIDGVRSK